MAANEKLKWCQKGRNDFECLICNRKLSSKQRVFLHLKAVHRLSSESNDTIKEYRKQDCWKKSDDGKYECSVCKKKLASKQRVLMHLHGVHRMTPVRREKKKYKHDKTESVPRSTAYRWERKKSGECANTSAKRTLFRDPSSTTGNEDLSVDPVELPGNDSGSRLDDSKTEKFVVAQEKTTDLSFSELLPVLCSDTSKTTCGTEEKMLLDGEFSNTYGLKKSSSNASIHSVQDFETVPPNFTSSDSEDTEFLDFNLPDTDDSIHSVHDFEKEPPNFISSDSEDTEFLDFNLPDTDDAKSLDFSSSDSDTDSDHDTASKSDADDLECHLDMPEKEYQALSLLSCFLRNQFSASASKDIVETLREIFPKLKEINTLNWDEMLSHIDNTSLKEIHYCELCTKVFPVENENVFHCQSTDCEGLRYKGPLRNQNKTSRQPRQSFVFADVGKQLTDLLQTPGIWEDIQATKKSAFERLNSGSSILTDIVDGQEYRKLMKDGFLKESENLTAIFNTDGVNLYSSSKIELWPIFLAINELSPPKRFSRENILLAAMWQGKGKPPFHEYFREFSSHLNALYTNGVEVFIDDDSFHVKLKIICGIMDLPAKAELLNMSYFNGPFPCITCEEEGKTVKQGKGTARCLPYRSPDDRSMERRHEVVIENMRSGSPKSRSKGFKGKSGISYLKDFDLVSGIVPDYMHGVCLGVTKTLMCKWFSSKGKTNEFFIGNHIEEISRRMQQFKPPHSIERLPRNLEKNYQHFKATELQTWLLYYAYPCLQDFLKDEYLENFLCLSEGIHILLGNAISEESLTKAKGLLQQFYASFARLYGEGSSGLNIHNTGSHLCDFVKLWGPIWCWSCFPFEDINAMLLNSVHGTGVVLKQAMKYRQAQLCIRRKGLELKKCNSWKVNYMASNCAVAGAMQVLQQHELEDSVKANLINLLQENFLDKLKKLNRVVVNEKRFYSEQYTRMQKRICTVVLFRNNEIGKIKYFVFCNYTDSVYAVLQKLERIPEGQENHYIPVTFSQEIVVSNVENLIEVLVYLDLQDVNRKYVIKMPNGYGHAIFK